MSEDFTVSVDLSGAEEADLEAPPKKRKKKENPTLRQLAMRKKAPGEDTTRRADDAYDTEPALALAICKAVSAMWPAAAAVGHDLRVLEPCAGHGPFAAAARATWPSSQILTVDIREECKASCEAIERVRFVHGDILSLPPPKVDLIVTNPPFKLAEQILLHLWPALPQGAVVAFLLAVTFVAGQDRWKHLFKEAPLTDFWPIVPRPSFGMKSGPKFEAGCFIWRKGEPARFQPLLWERT